MARPRWEVVGGEDRGGVLVRESCELGSPKLPERLSTGALIEELELQEERLRYRRLTGSGPAEGWISIRLEHKELAIRCGTEAPGQAVRCPEGHPMTWIAAPWGLCDGCLADVKDGEKVLDCRPCNWYLCAACAGRAQAAAGSAPALALTHDLWDPGASVPQQAPGVSAAAEEPEQDWEAEVELTPLECLPESSQEDLKWFVWNQVWRRCNGKMAASAKTQMDREKGLRRAQEDAERLTKHLRAVEETRTLSRKTLRQVKRQAEAVGDAALLALREGRWLAAAQAQALPRPGQLLEPLWRNLVVAVRSAGVAVFFQCVDAGPACEPHKDYFLERWELLRHQTSRT